MDSYDDYNALLAVYAGLTVFFVIFGIIGYVLSSWFLMRIFDKAGVQGKWRAWVPVYNTMVFFKLGDLSPWLVLYGLGAGIVLSWIPFLNVLPSIALAVFAAMAAYRVGLKLGKDAVWVVLYILVSIVWMGILAFDKSRWNSNVPPAPWANNAFLADRTVWAGIPAQTPAGGYGAAAYGAPAYPATDQYGQPQPPQYGAPQAGAYGEAQAPQYGQPQPPQYGAPQAGAYGEPQAPQYGQPQPPQYGQPQPPQYGAPQAGPHGQPQFDAPQPPQYGAPQEPAYGTPQEPASGQPQPPQFDAATGDAPASPDVTAAPADDAAPSGYVVEESVEVVEEPPAVDFGQEEPPAVDFGGEQPPSAPKQ